MNEIKAHIKTILLLKKNNLPVPSEISVAGRTISPDELISRWKKLTDLNRMTTRMEIASALKQDRN